MTTSAAFGRVTAAAAAVLLLTGLGGSAGARAPGPTRFEAAALAIASPPTPKVADLTEHVASGQRQRLTATTSATSTVNCDRCTAQAAAITVLRVQGKGRLVANNLAAAWATCAACSARALALQIVIAPSGRRVVASNRAIAADVTCRGCTTQAVAAQFIVLMAHPRTLSRHALKQIAAQLLDTLTGPDITTGPVHTATAPAAAAIGPALGRIQQVIGTDLRTNRIRRNLDLS